jgi:hypothetical protein
VRIRGSWTGGMVAKGASSSCSGRRGTTRRLVAECSECDGEKARASDVDEAWRTTLRNRGSAGCGS